MRKSRSGLFLMELIIVIFFFALTSAVCLQIFVKAHFTMEESKGLNYACVWAENVGELFYEYGNDPDTINSYLPNDNDYSIDLSFSEDEDFIYLDYSCDYLPTDDHLYDFTYKKYKKKVSTEQ